MITMAQAQEISDMLRILEEVGSWRKAFESQADRLKEWPYIYFEEIYATKKMGSKRGPGFEGTIEVPCQFAIEMMAWLEARVIVRLRELGVDA